MDIPLVLAGLAMGVAASPHCAFMCGAPCAALTSGCKRSTTGFHLGRLFGYMAGGAVAAASVSALGAWSQAAPALRPLWTGLHLAFLALGLWWLATGRQPAWMRRDGAVPVRFFRQVPADPASLAGTVGPHGRPWRAGFAGLAWVAWPCGALQGALLLSALASSPQSGAVVMAAFALGSMPALAVAPWVWGRWRAMRGTAATTGEVATLGFRVAGAGIVLSSGWALTHGLWERFAAWCVS
ncbi:MAG TPA: sulfite exporter TauE/SafE family protein [Albitalea sp.]